MTFSRLRHIYAIVLYVAPTYCTIRMYVCSDVVETAVLNQTGMLLSNHVAKW